ncbi:embryonic protein UVS.2 [Trichonephila clavipes]|nr:embryonic protein UVS.2 [Trichonephila clavipes]
MSQDPNRPEADIFRLEDMMRAGMRDERFRWPGYPGRAVIPFVLDRSVYGIRNVIYQGMEHYHRSTCIRFKERTNERDFIRIFYGVGCWSVIGRNGGMQNLSLGNGCAWVGLVIHELGHAIGLYHEHQRSDRDNYITVYRNNVIPEALDLLDRYYPYKLQVMQELLPHDFETRHLFSLRFLARLEVDPEWPWYILWTDEAHFHLDGSVNTHNCRIWETENLYSTLQVPLLSPKVTVGCGFSASFILDPYFFKELGAGGPVTCSITGQLYASLLRKKFIPDLQARQCLSRIIFMQDGAPTHITRCVKVVFKHHFTEEGVISRQIRSKRFLTLGPFKTANQMHNFVLTDPDKEIIYAPYEYASIMHYGNYAFSRQPNRLPTMVAKTGVRLYEPYEKPGFTQTDLYRIKQLYKC